MNRQIRKSFRSRDFLIMGLAVGIGMVVTLLGPGWRELGYVIVGTTIILSPLFRTGYRIDGYNGVFGWKGVRVPRDLQDEILAFLTGEVQELDLGGKVPNGAIVQLFTQKGDRLFLAQYFDYALFDKGFEFPVVEISESQYNVLTKLSNIPS